MNRHDKVKFILHCVKNGISGLKIEPLRRGATITTRLKTGNYGKVTDAKIDEMYHNALELSNTKATPSDNTKDYERRKEDSEKRLKKLRDNRPASVERLEQLRQEVAQLRAENEGLTDGLRQFRDEVVAVTRGWNKTIGEIDQRIQALEGRSTKATPQQHKDNTNDNTKAIPQQHKGNTNDGAGNGRVYINGHVFTLRLQNRKVNGKVYPRWIVNANITRDGKKKVINIALGKDKPGKEAITKRILAYLKERPEVKAMLKKAPGGKEGE